MGFVCFLQKLFLQMVKFLALCQSFLPCRQFDHFLINGMMYRRMVSFCHNSVDCFLCIFSNGIHLFRHRLLICTGFLTIQSVMKMSSSADQFEHTSWQFESMDSTQRNCGTCYTSMRSCSRYSVAKTSYVFLCKCLRMLQIEYDCSRFTQNISSNAHSLPSCAA